MTSRFRLPISLLAPIALLLLGIGWAFASPHGSSADDDYHLTSIWCSHGPSPYCQDSGDDVGVLAPRIIAYPACYVTWPATVSAGCSLDLDYNLIYTQRIDPSDGAYPDGFYWAMGWLAGKDVPSSVQVMRITNVAIASLLLTLAVLVLQPKIRRAAVLSWSVGLIPLGIFFLASTNPSAWVIAGVGLYWAFLLSVLRDFEPRRSVFWLRVLGVVGSASLALAARSDAGAYLAISSVAVAVVALPRNRFRWKVMLPLSTSVVLGLLVIAYVALRDRYLSFPISWPGAQTATDQPNPIVKTVLEVPGFFVGILGGQRPGYVLSDSGFNQGADGYRPTGLLYGLGWAEVSLPSIVAICGLISATILVTAGLTNYRRSRLLAIGFLIMAVVAQILIMRAMVDFVAFWEIQPRYFIPMLLVILGFATLKSRPRRAFLSRAQGLLAAMSVLLAGSVAWTVTAARYAIGPDAAFTNFGQEPDWWWATGPSRLVWLLLVVIATALWAWSTIWVVGTKPVAIPSAPTLRAEHGRK